MAPLHDVYFAAPLRHQDLEPFRQWRSDQTTAISERSIRQADPAVRQQLLAGALRDNDTRLLAALIPHTQPDPAEVTAWMETNDDHAVASAVALTPSIAHGVFADAGTAIRRRRSKRRPRRSKR